SAEEPRREPRPPLGALPPRLPAAHAAPALRLKPAGGVRRMWEVIAAVVLAIGSVLAAAVKGALDRRKDTSARAITEHAGVYDVLTDLRDATDAARVVIVKTHNGGGLPSAKNALYSSALYEVNSDRAGRIKHRW